MGYSMEETAEFDKEQTIDGLESALKKLGHTTVRVGHFKSLMQRLLNGERWDLVFNICEGLFGTGRESLVPALLDAYQIPYVFSGPTVLGVCLDKALTKQIIRDAGIPSPDFIVVRSETDFKQPKPPFPLFLKPISEGTGKGISDRSLVKTQSEFELVCLDLLARFNQPVLVEAFLPGREYTVGIVGNGKSARAIGGMEVIFRSDIPEIYSYENKENYEDVIEYRKLEGTILDECAQLALRVWHTVGAFDGGRVDMKTSQSGRVEFIEINPLAGLNYQSSDLPILARLNGIPFDELIGMIMDAATTRIFTK